MSNYKTHTKFNIFIALPILLLAIFYLMEPKLYLLITFGSAFVYSTLFMSPDLDLAHQIRLFSLRGFLSIPFRSYSRLFSHRGLSHHVLLGSATRILWLSLWGLLIFYLIYKSIPDQSTLLRFYKLHQPYIIYGLAGVCFADWGHLLLDRKK